MKGIHHIITHQWTKGDHHYRQRHHWRQRQSQRLRQHHHHHRHHGHRHRHPRIVIHEATQFPMEGKSL